MEREVGGEIGMGNTCKPMAVSFQCMTKFTTNKKKKFLLKKKKLKRFQQSINNKKIAINNDKNKTKLSLIFSLCS